MERQGWRTTEFWVSILMFVLVAMMESGALGDQHWAVKAAGLVLAGLTAAGYSMARGKVKAASSLANGMATGMATAAELDTTDPTGPLS